MYPSKHMCIVYYQSKESESGVVSVSEEGVQKIALMLHPCHDLVLTTSQNFRQHVKMLMG